MHRIVLLRLLSTTGLIAAAQTFSLPSHAEHKDAKSVETPSNLAPQPLIEHYADDDETEQGIAKLPNIPGDRETYRRNMLERAWHEKRDTKKSQEQKFAAIYEWVSAADGIRSTTFTRCNLGLIAHELGRTIEAAKHFRREFQVRYPHDGHEQKKRVRDVCEIMGRVAMLRVSELNIVAPARAQVWVNSSVLGTAPLMGSVFVEPNEEHRVRAQLEDGSEVRETISLGAGESRTLELKSSKKLEPKFGGLPMVPRHELTAGESAYLMGLTKPPPPAAKTVILGTGIGMAAVGLAAWIAGAGLTLYADGKLDSTKAFETKTTCREASPSERPCTSLYSTLDSAHLLGYAGTLSATLGAAGIVIYALYPERDSLGNTGKAIMPSGLGVRGSF